MRKFIFTASVLFITAFGIFAGGKQEPGTAAKASGNQAVKLVFGHTLPPTHVAHEAILEMVGNIKARSNGGFVIDLFPASQLGSAKDQVEAVSRGTQDIGFDGAGVMSQFFPRISVLDMPFMFKSYEELEKVFLSPVGQELRTEIEQKLGVTLIDICYYGARVVSSNRPIRSAADFKGFKIRTPEVDEWLRSFRALGASPTPIAFSEVYFSLQTKVVDGQENPLSTIYAYKFYEVQKYITMTQHQIGANYIIMNKKSWEKLPEAFKTLFKEEVRKTMLKQNNRIMSDDKALIEKLKTSGVEFIFPDDSAKAEIKAAVQAVYPHYENKWGKGTVDRINQALAK